MKRKKAMINLLLLSVIYLIYLCNFPLKAAEAELYTKEYYIKQGFAEDEILLKSIYRNTKLNTYSIDLVFSSQPMIQYTYTYLPDKGKQRIYCYMEEIRSPSRRYQIKKLLNSK